MPTDEDIKLREFINGLINENKLLLLTITDLKKQIEQLTQNNKDMSKENLQPSNNEEVATTNAIDEIVGSLSEDSYVDIARGIMQKIK